MRTTLYPSLWDDFYRLPEVGGVYTPDVLVHRDCGPEAEDLQKRDRFFVDVVSAAMLRFPETVGGIRNNEERAACSCGVSYCDRDRELVTHKMRAVLRMAQSQGAEKLVLGAWGCGAYGNPVREVAKIWKRVLCGSHRKMENWHGIKEVVFAINDRTMLKEFERCFADVLGPAEVSPSPPTELVEGSSRKETSDELSELVTKIQETEMQLDQITNPRSKARLRNVLDGLNQQLVKVGSTESPDEDLQMLEEEEEGYVVDGFPVASSDPEEKGYYDFDEDDVASSSGGSSPMAGPEFHFQPNVDYALQTGLHTDSVPSSPSVPLRPFFPASSNAQSGRLDEESGWFSGSMDGLTALLKTHQRMEGSPVLRPESMGNDVEPLDMESYIRRFSDQDA